MTSQSDHRRSAATERRNEAYRQYFRWLAQVPLSNENKAASLARAQEARVAVSDLLLHASPSVKAKAKEVESALGEANNQLIVELAKMSKEAKAGQWEHVPQNEFNLLASLWEPAIFYERVWPVAQELANMMAAEIGDRPTSTS